MTKTIPVLHEIEVNITRLLGAALTLLAGTPLFMKQSLPEVTPEAFFEAVYLVEGQNRALILNSALPEGAMLVMQRNTQRVMQLAVLGRVAQHLERSSDLLAPEECAIVAQFLGPVADSVFLLGTRILEYLLNPEKTESLTLAQLPWEQVMVEGGLQAARAEIAATRTLSPLARRYSRSTLWAFQVACDAMLTVGSR
jgi:hypothetical protein